MDKEQCNDRDGGNHFGSYGWMDGYQGSANSCRCGLKSRSGACKDVDGCMEESHKKCVELQSNIISYNINNMVAGERQRAKESIDDKKIADAKRLKEKDEAEKIKQEAEAKKIAEEAKKVEPAKEEPKKVEEPKKEESKVEVKPAEPEAKKEEPKVEEKKNEDKKL